MSDNGCCNHEEAVYWNPFNRVVQCHKCGQVFVPEDKTIDISKLEQNIEFLSEQVHNAWMEEKRKQGFHAPNECESINHKSFQSADWQSKERLEDLHNPKFYKWCDKCHTDLYPYAEFPENIKEYDRVTVRTVLAAISKMEEV